MIRRGLLLGLVLLAACETAEAPVEGGVDAGVLDAASVDAAVEAWEIQALVDAEVLEVDASWCLQGTGTQVAAGSVVRVAAAGEHFWLLADGRYLRKAEAAEVARPAAPMAITPAAVLQRESERFVFAADGCVAASAAKLAIGAQVGELERYTDANHRGYVVVDRELGLLPARFLEVEGRTFPWDSGVQLYKQVDNGYVIGAGVLLGPHELLTAKHLGVDETWCYTREPRVGEAAEAGKVRCDNIVGAGREHASVDAEIIELREAEAAPFAQVRRAPLEAGEALYTSKYSQLRKHDFRDSVVKAVTNANAYCHDWPAGTSFFPQELILEGGDSGGPAWVGDELVGLVHGERCRPWGELSPRDHVFVHVPGILGFIDG